MTILDWRSVPPAVLEPLVHCERERWLRVLQWDTTSSWREIEHARTTWGLPGLVAMDASGACRGFAFYLVEDGRLEIGGVTSDEVTATDALLDAVLDAAAAAGAEGVRTLLFDGAAGLRSGLTARAFDVEQCLYLSRRLRPHVARAAGVPGAAPDAPGGSFVETLDGFSTWNDADVAPAAALLRRSYDQVAGRLFAPANAPAEWERYVRNLVTYGGCGVLNAAATRVVRDGDAMRALALVTDLGPGVAHIVQFALDPVVRGRGLARALLEEVCTGLAERGASVLTLLVAASNLKARALYDAAGFRQDATFLAAMRQPRRLTSVGFDAPGAMTRR
jgi:ribosomal protein S18 acetylase RimI-like enzyme